MKKNIAYIILIIWAVLSFISCKDAASTEPDLRDLEQDTVTWTAPQNIDFAVQSLVLLGLDQELLDSVDILPNEENSIILDLKKASTEPLILCLVGYQGERLVDTVNAKSGILKVLFKQDYQAKTYEVATDINFNKCLLNGDYVGTPILEEGKTVLRFGWGLPKGDYQFFVADRGGKRSEVYNLSKDTATGYLEIKFDLSQLSSLGWRYTYIGNVLEKECSQYKYNFTMPFFSSLEGIFRKKKFDRAAVVRFLEKRKLQELKTNLASLSRDSVSYLSNYIAASTLIYELLAKIENWERQNVVDVKLKTLALDLLQETSEKVDKLLEKENRVVLRQKTNDYFIALTGGHATTSAIVQAIRKHFELLAI